MEIISSMVQLREATNQDSQFRLNEKSIILTVRHDKLLTNCSRDRNFDTMVSLLTITKVKEFHNEMVQHQ